MNAAQIIILSLALALNSFISYAVAGVFLKKEKQSLMVMYSAIMLASLILLIGTGLWLGLRIGSMSGQNNYYISFGILLIMGLKVIFDSIRSKPEDKIYDLSETRNIVLISIADGITPLIISIAAGLTLEKIYPSWIIICGWQILALVSGLYLGSKYGNQAYRFRTGPIGGLILLAAALKLLIDFIGY